jgi:uncharacterized protein (TIGR02466 family)|tara:strand:- start:511 stop:1089 length:579 start_codon:yes stop_codon:yes gene_type:complete
MIKEAFFPTFVYAKDINLNLNLLTNAIVEWSKKDKGLVKTNVKGWHSPTNMHTIPVFKPLVDELYKMQSEIYKEEFLERKPILGNMWANINYKGALNRPHVHANSLFSGAYYIKVPNNSGFLKINDPRQGTHFIKPARKDGIPIYLAPEVHIEPKENRIIMFPSWLEHCVEMNESDDIRISVSFNFLQDGFQ